VICKFLSIENVLKMGLFKVGVPKIKEKGPQDF